MAVCTNFVLINKILCGYGTMFLKYEDFLQKKQGAVSHFRTEGDQTLLHYSVMLSPKANVRTAHMPYTKVRNFLTWSDFTSSR